jgi:nucleoside-diphosphate kinase
MLYVSWFDKHVLSQSPGYTTFGVIKPDGVPHIQEIITFIEKENLKVRHLERKLLTLKDVRALYWSHVGASYYNRNEDHMISGPSYLMALEGIQAVYKWKENLMPEIRKKLGGMINPFNLVHGSDSNENAFRELHYFFGQF